MADNFNHRIQVFDSDGNFITKWGDQGIGDGQFDSPLGIALDAVGHVYVADFKNSRIQVFEGLVFDSDGDGLPDNEDSCPDEDATGFDANNDGCIDRVGDLVIIVATLVDEGVILEQMRDSLVSKVENAGNSETKENICVAINELEAFKRQSNAQRGKKISEDAADLLTAFTDSVITGLLCSLPAGESC